MSGPGRQGFTQGLTSSLSGWLTGAGAFLLSYLGSDYSTSLKSAHGDSEAAETINLRSNKGSDPFS